MATKMTIEKMRAAVEAHDAEVIAQQEAEKTAYLAPAVDLVESDAFKAIADMLAAIGEHYADDLNIAVHLNCLTTAMPNLVGELQRRRQS